MKLLPAKLPLPITVLTRGEAFFHTTFVEIGNDGISISQTYKGDWMKLRESDLKTDFLGSIVTVSELFITHSPPER